MYECLGGPTICQASPYQLITPWASNLSSTGLLNFSALLSNSIHFPGFTATLNHPGQGFLLLLGCHRPHRQEQPQ